MTAPPAGRAGSTWFVGLVVAGLMVQEVGASLAVTLFPQAGALGMVMLRLVFSAAVLLALVRPRVRGHRRRAWIAVTGYGIVLALMNSLFYEGLSRLPQGVTVTLEVLGPLVLAVIAARRRAAWLWAGLAFGGVVALGGGGWDRLDVVGVLFTLGAAASWALYIVTAARVGTLFPKIDGLAIAMAIGAVLSLPLGVVDAGPALLRPDVLGVGAAVALLSSAVPYAFELVALRRVPASVFAILMSTSPAIATLAGLVLLGQRLSPLELAGMGLVVVAGIGAVRGGRDRAGVPPRGEAGRIRASDLAD